MTVRCRALRPIYLDASALVKLVIQEPYSERIRTYVFQPSQSWRVCTSFCFFEALSVLKRQHLNKQLSKPAYISGARRLFNLQNNEVEIIETDISIFSGFLEAERIVVKYDVDFLDAFQILSIENTSRLLSLAPNSQPLLITADSGLHKVAKKEGIESWFCRETSRPTT